MRVLGFALCACLLLAPALRPSDGDLTLEVDDAVELAETPFRPPVTFLVRPGGPDMPWLGGKETDAFAGMRRWQLQIFDFDDRKVHFIQGEGPPPSRRISWDGAGREGRLLRDGFYTARFAWVDAADTARRSGPVKVGLLTPPGINDFADLRAQVIYTRDGMIIRLPEELTFNHGEWTLRSQAAAALGKIADFLQRYPRNRVAVVGHTDVTGSSAGNQELSLRRARAIERFLLERGVDGGRVVSEGRGADEPVASNATPGGRKQNRRVDIVLLKAII